MGDYELSSESGEELNRQTLAGKWLLVTVTNKCELSCQQTLFTLRQARKSTGVNRKHIVPIIIEKQDNAIDYFTTDLSKAFPQLKVASASPQFLGSLEQAYQPIENSIFMIDPYSNLMMVYPAGQDQSGLMHDLDRLLKVNPPKG